ncbi:MAG: hypothetical protein COT73_06460 [Bdellovibrio sp. CG10_big_fil_rev_8_21_14_0_10_47_8]|nr:MAG: hypothetical protein COT73_06460 [Bdellovibrio sp. CG10_big_fil_rev_8_21_14_0_10_47_8]
MVFISVLTVFVGALVWRVDQLLFSDRLDWNEAGSRAQLSTMVYSLSTEARHLREIISISLSDLEKNPADYAATTPAGQFQMLARVQPGGPGGEWKFEHSWFLEKSPTKAWAVTYAGLALKSVNEKDVKVGVSYWLALMDPHRKPFLLLLNHESSGWSVGLLGSEVFQSLMDQQKGQMSSVFVVNQLGQALGHTTPEYVGSLLSEDPLVASIIKTNVGSGSGLFQNLRGESVQGLYEQVASSNLYLVITTSVAQLMQGRNATRLQLILMGLGLILIGSAIFIFFDRGERRATAQQLPPMPPTGPQVTVAAPAPTDKMAAYIKVAASLSHELKMPLTSIIGHVQLALNLVADKKTIDHLQKIDQEARSVRDLAQKLMTFAGQDKNNTIKAELNTVVSKVLKNLEARFSTKGIKLHKKIDVVSAFTMSIDLMERAIENLVLNSFEAMDRAPKKELTVELHQMGDQIVLTVQDSGEGIEGKDLGKVFEPFFTTRSSGQHVGLGLSAAMGIFQEFHGQVQIKSEKGKGTTVTVSFDLLAASTKPAEVPSKKPLPAPVVKKEEPAPLLEVPGLSLKKPAPGVSIDPLLVDNSIERLLDGLEPDEDSLTAKKLPPEKAQALPPAPAPEFGDDKTADIQITAADISAENPSEPEKPSVKTPDSNSVFSAKIDKPQIQLNRKTSRLDEVPVSIRRPGERM